MKKLYFLVAFTVSLLCNAQTILNQPETTTRTVQDPQAVILTTGFRAVSSTSNPFIAKVGASTDTGSTPIDSGAGSGNPSGTTDSPSNKFHDTQGSIDVTGGGQLQYTLPIALPPGIKSVAPQVNLVYTSGSGNGIAGYGWSLSGLSSITRMGKTIEKDGAVGGLNLDYSDYYSFNGQRLILSKDSPPGIEYGKANAEYVTEKYSNVKIKSLGTISGQPWTGPEYWQVNFEDGSQAWYGATTTGTSAARTPLEYNIVKWKDAQGNYITYNYIQDINTNVAVISSIQWGGNETLNKQHINKISFNYKNRLTAVESYVDGVQFSQIKLLETTEVTSNGKPYKNYSISHKNNGYDESYLVDKIVESNSINEQSNPVQFTYDKTLTNIDNWHRSSFYNYDSKTLEGDFNGDGNIDFLTYIDTLPPVESYYHTSFTKTGVYLISDVYTALLKPATIIYLGDVINKDDLFNNATVLSYKKNNIVNNRQGFIIYRKKLNINTSKNDLELTFYTIDENNQLRLDYTKTIPNEVYDISAGIPSTNPHTPGDFTTTSIGNMLSLDLNGDGLSEIIMKLDDKSCIKSNDNEPNGLPVYTLNCSNSNRYLVLNTDQNVQNTNSYSEIYFNSNNVDIFSKYKIGDFDGDGINDFLNVDGSGKPFLINIKQGSNGNYSVIEKPFGNNSLSGLLDYSVLGDFNGDGKTDIYIPVAINQSSWQLYTSTGSSFKVGLSKLSGLLGSRIVNGVNGKFEIHRNQFLSCDYNNDGKDDVFLMEFIKEYTPTGYTNQYKINYKNQIPYLGSSWGFSDSGPTVTIDPNDLSSELAFGYFDYKGVTGNFSKGSYNCNILLLGIEASTTGYKALATIQSYNNVIENRIKSISQGGITTTVDYKYLDKVTDPNFYNTIKKEIYPYFELEDVKRFFAVSQLRQNIIVNSQSKIKLQDFRYRGMITHLQGRGMIGFRQTARSSWYAAGFENTKIWSGAEIDPLNEGVPVKEWSIHTNTESQIFPTDLSVNNTQLTSFKSTTYKTDKLLNGVVQTGTIADADKPKIVTAIVPISTTSKNFITNDTTTDTVEYGNYYLPNKTVSNINSGYGVKTTILEYVPNNLSGVGKDYFVGRPQSKTETMVAYGDTKSAKVDYTYANNLLDTQKTWNRDNSDWLQEKYTYDGFGNITQKISSNSIDANKQTIKSTYESLGRFVTKTTDNLGLEINITYNDWGQVLTQIDPLLNKLTNTYDAWGKLLTTKNNLSGTTSYTYEKLGNGDIKVTEYSPDNGQNITFTNNLGQNYKSTTKGFAQGIYTSKSVEFDVLGRKTKESEPYFEGSETPRWNVIVYDDSVYPGKATATAFNGKKMETSVSGKTTTVKELNGYNRINTKTTDALGNVVSTTDKGGTITFAYNAAGEQTHAVYGANDVKTNYDAWGNKSKFDDPSNGVYEYTYLGYFGAISKIKSPKGPNDIKEYTYNSSGQLITQKETSTDGTSTNKVISFSYDDKGRVIGKSGTSNGNGFSSYINFDSQGKSISSGESSNGKYFMQKGITYDDKARVTSYEKSLYSSGILTKVTIENVYSSWCGDLYQVKDKTSGKILWQLDETNAKGLVKFAKLGGTTINNLYDANYFLISTAHTKTVGGNTVLQAGYTFDAIKNELTHRTRGGDFNLSESFTYDDNNRLLSWTNPRTGQLSNNVYDIKGRITSNDQVGTIKFENSISLYRPSSVVLNAAGTTNYNNDLIQTISYNENNDPIFIDGVKGDVAFQYGLTAMRQRVTYGGNFDKSAEGKFTKFYSEDGSYEILKDNVTGKEKHLLYIGGTPYESNIVFIKNYTETTGSYKFLHKDYLGSILAVSDENGNVLEQRHYDAWGNFTHLKIGSGPMITDKNIIDNTALLVDRGYTSHEHFAEVGIIHMNGRLYDPLLRRFLNADENIQDPTNTQNYNKYGYVLNNPLMFSDPSGEFWGLIAGALLGGYLSGVQANGNWNPGQWNWNKTWFSIVGGVFFGASLGMVLENTGTATGVRIVEGSLAGAIGGGFNAIVSGQNILSGALLGGISGGGSASANYVASNFVNSLSHTTSTFDPFDSLYKNYEIQDETMMIINIPEVILYGIGTRNTMFNSSHFAYNSSVIHDGINNVRTQVSNYMFEQSQPFRPREAPMESVCLLSVPYMLVGAGATQLLQWAGLSGETASKTATVGMFLFTFRPGSVGGEMATAESQGGLNLFKFGSQEATTAEGWKSGDRFLKMFDQGSPKLNWKQNSGFLRSEMNLGEPIFDSYRLPNGNLIPTGGFLNAERSLLQNRGWSYNPGQGAWLPPIK